MLSPRCRWLEARHAAQVDRLAEIRSNNGGISDEPVPEQTSIYDVVVIGGGPAGENIAQNATEGIDVTAVLIEDGLLGGECAYCVCVPSKALLVPVDGAADSEI
ncbi:FAD-dependent oxidoreductase [uncultured Actinomyces sp.]|jgi:dihydrolipoyl dehydrogenase (E3 component of alpha keto acid dehydrogenase complexes) (dihydrolipoamide|uniref:FAD-dependent oxidoreductase n=1 Tax=uncultured Actinomyces sp. TaxID=249061 RepID=UPI0028D1A6DE|nr:FAD-dependent oxidoreductase [uncultured Actinomyces sp.]